MRNHFELILDALSFKNKLTLNYSVLNKNGYKICYIDILKLNIKNLMIYLASKQFIIQYKYIVGCIQKIFSPS